MAGGYRFLEHTTDAVIEAYGETVEEAFAQAAKALNDTMIDIRGVKLGLETMISAQGHDLESLLFDWLDKVMLLLVVDGVVTSEFVVKIDRTSAGYALVATAKGEKLDLNRHEYKVEIKAVTYHEMSVRQDIDKTTVRFLLDL